MQNYIKYFFYDKNCGHIFLVCAPTLFLSIGLDTNLSLILGDPRILSCRFFQLLYHDSHITPYLVSLTNIEPENLSFGIPNSG